jgi:hypothetical protein
VTRFLFRLGSGQTAAPRRGQTIRFRQLARGHEYMQPVDRLRIGLQRQPEPLARLCQRVTIVTAPAVRDLIHQDIISARCIEKRTSRPADLFLKLAQNSGHLRCGAEPTIVKQSLVVLRAGKPRFGMKMPVSVNFDTLCLAFALSPARIPHSHTKIAPGSLCRQVARLSLGVSGAAAAGFGRIRIRLRVRPWDTPAVRRGAAALSGSARPQGSIGLHRRSLGTLARAPGQKNGQTGGE